ncbi:MAG: hypothetical protein ACRD1P_06215 [Thermoanaerobaculia bacterium]
MMLVTPILTGLVGALLGTSQSLQLRSLLVRPWAWVLATCAGLGIGLAAGVVVVEKGGGFLAGHAVNVVRLSPFHRALSFAVIGLVAGLALGLCQQLVLRRQAPAVKGWVVTTALALGLAFPVASVLVDSLLSGIASPSGVLGFVLGAGLIFGALTARPLARAA